MKKIAVAGCKHTTKELILGLKRNGFEVSQLITISPEKGEEQNVAGYMDLTKFCKEEKIPIYIANKYSLKSDEDKAAIQKMDVDLLLVMGWQRLIPDWFLEKLTIGAFGMHGSSKPLPHGRGRSPMNWSLIQNKKIFYTHFFRYKPGVDDGDIVGVQTFDINQFDSCLTLHFKNTLSMIKLCAKHLPELIEGKATFTPQKDEKPTFYPKRTAEDGIIYWEDTTKEIYNLIRGVTKPFPGAFTYLDKKKITIWKGQPFDNQIPFDGKSGEILEVMSNGMTIIKTGDTTFLITEHEGHDFTQKDIGKKLDANNISRKVWEDLPK